MLHILCYYLLYFLLCQIIIVSISHYHFWQNIFLQCTLNFSENNFFCSILIFGEFPILWILAGGSASLLLWKLRMPDICSTSSGVWPGLICLDTPVLDSEWSFIIFRWHRKPKEQTDKLLEIIGEFIKMTGYRIDPLGPDVPIVLLGAGEWPGSGEGRREWRDCLVGPQQTRLPRPPWSPAFPRSALVWAPALMTCPTLCQPAGHGPPLTGERVSNLEELPFNEYRECIKVQTDKGTEVATNLVIVCNGIKINSFAYRSAFGKQEAEPGLLPGCPLSLAAWEGPGLSPRNWHLPAFPLHPNSSFGFFWMVTSNFKFRFRSTLAVLSSAVTMT